MSNLGFKRVWGVYIVNSGVVVYHERLCQPPYVDDLRPGLLLVFVEGPADLAVGLLRG